MIENTRGRPGPLNTRVSKGRHPMAATTCRSAAVSHPMIVWCPPSALMRQIWVLPLIDQGWLWRPSSQYEAWRRIGPMMMPGGLGRRVVLERGTRRRARGRCNLPVYIRRLHPIGSEDKTVRLWDVASGAELRRFEGHEGGVTCLAKVGANILSAAEDKTLRLWDTATGTLVRVLGRVDGF